MLLTRLAFPGALVLCAVVACGGSAFTSGTDGTGGAAGATNSDGGVSAKGGTVGNGGARATGGTSDGGSIATGGANAAGGSKASGGTSAGGAIASGGTSVTGGATGSGGAIARGGSAGSASGGATNTGGSAGQTNYDACTASSQCTLAQASCCAACEPTELEHFVAVNASRLNDYLATKVCVNALCAPCVAPSPETTQSGNYGARCVSGHCQAFDVRTTELSKCEDSTDCTLRVGVHCCEGCSGGLTAVSKNANLQQALCGDTSGPGGAVACPACAPILPSNASPSCSAGHCAVTWSGGATN